MLIHIWQNHICQKNPNQLGNYFESGNYNQGTKTNNINPQKCPSMFVCSYIQPIQEWQKPKSKYLRNRCNVRTIQVRWIFPHQKMTYWIPMVTSWFSRVKMEINNFLLIHQLTLAATYKISLKHISLINLSCNVICTFLSLHFMAYTLTVWKLSEWCLRMNM